MISTSTLVARITTINNMKREMVGECKDKRLNNILKESLIDRLINSFVIFLLFLIMQKESLRHILMQ